MTGFDSAATEALYERRALIARCAEPRPRTDVPAGPFGWTHGDFQYRNLLRDAGRVVAILDWDRLGVRPYGEEVARTAQVQFGVGGVFDLDRVAAFCCTDGPTAPAKSRPLTRPASAVTVWVHRLGEVSAERAMFSA
ncbi:phosphotransferase [Streptomyces adustus]|uniref:phosphotransferase n=1 Tax=Streptomyces adustus TaxID=1609272 RepID=UPI0035E03776